MTTVSRVPRIERDQFVGDSPGDHDRQPGVYPQTSQVGDFGKPLGQFGQPPVGQHQRIAAAEDNLVDRAIFGNRLQDEIQISLKRHSVAMGGAFGSGFFLDSSVPTSVERKMPAGNRTGNGRRKPHLLPSIDGLCTSEEDQGQAGPSVHRADRSKSRA